MSDSAQLPSQTDEELMLILSKGESTALDHLFGRYRQRIFAFFRRRTSDLSNAEELTQETFIALLRAAPKYEQRAPFRTYLFAIAFRILRADHRKRTFRSFFFLSTANTERALAIEKDEDRVLWLRQALNRLEHIHCEILLLREFEQLSYTEIAEVLKLPLNTVRSRLFRARLALRDQLEPSLPKDSVAVGELS